MNQLGFFTVQDRYAALSEGGDPLVKLNAVLPWEVFLPYLNEALQKEHINGAGRPSFDFLMMFKVLVLQSLYNLADDQMEYQIRDRFSFIRFLGLTLEDKVPDAKTIWHYRKLLTQAGVIGRIFKEFDRYLGERGFKAKKGQLIDATIVEVPRQKMTMDERQEVDAGETPEDWSKNAAKLCQKDLEARWTKKRGQSYYGYKNHINADAKHKLIREYRVTPASVHDSQVLDDLLTRRKNSRDVYADSAYRSEEREARLKAGGYRSHICGQGRRNRPLSEFQKALNRRRAKIRSRVEHIFGAMSQAMEAGFVRCRGMMRVAARIGLNNLAYNFRRYAYLALR